MKKIFTLLLALKVLSSTTIIAQVNFNNQIIVYFKSGVQRNAPNYSTATVSSANVLDVLSTYRVPITNVVPTFPAFDEADTIITEAKFSGGLTGEDSRQMNGQKFSRLL